MANIAIIFAGGTGTRMNTKSRPKQFLELHNKPIIVYTTEIFNNHPEIDGIVIVVLSEWIDYCGELVQRFGLSKVRAIVSGGRTAIESQKNGLLKAQELYPDDSVVLIHDGVRPLIDELTITNNIISVKKNGSSITTTPAIETIAIKNESNQVGAIVNRSSVELIRAPQGFILKDILQAHERASEENLEFIDSASLMQHYGHALFTVTGPPENIKITTPNDYYTFRALIDARESMQIIGV